MKAYMGFHGGLGSEEGACLIFANNAKEAKSLAFGVINNWFDSEWVDTRVRLIKDSEYLFQYRVSFKSHTIEAPPTCSRCQMWGTGEIVFDICKSCREIME